MRYCVELTKTMGVALLPACWFFEHAEHAAGALRISFCKQDSSLLEAARRIEAWHAQPSASSTDKVFA
jgi:aspartate/methionine/tyrosine aminotransferase